MSREDYYRIKDLLGMIDDLQEENERMKILLANGRCLNDGCNGEGYMVNAEEAVRCQWHTEVADILEEL